MKLLLLCQLRFTWSNFRYSKFRPAIKRNSSQAEILKVITTHYLLRSILSHGRCPLINPIELPRSKLHMRDVIPVWLISQRIRVVGETYWRLFQNRHALRHLLSQQNKDFARLSQNQSILEFSSPISVPDTMTAKVRTIEASKHTRALLKTC